MMDAQQNFQSLSQQRRAKSAVRLVDDDPSVLKALSVFLTFDGWTVRTYDDANAFLSKDDLQTPGCLVLDVRMPQMSGIELQNEMHRRGIRLPIIFLSAHGDIEMAVEAVQRGARTFLTKPPKPEKLLAEIEKATLADWSRRQTENYAESLDAQWRELTPAEKQVAMMVGKGLSNAMIAETLGVGERTVRAQRAAIYGKLDIENAVELADFLHERQEAKQTLGLESGE